MYLKKVSITSLLRPVVVLMAICLGSSGSRAQTPVPGGMVYKITIRNTTCNFDQKYTAFIPDDVATVRGILVHQHGCTMEGTGAPTAYDIQYQALAKKWGLVLVGPDLYTACNNKTCGWIYPEKYSGEVLISALDSIARLSSHPELNSVPWLLWGHSGGGYWVLAMAAAYPEKILAVFAYSPAFNPSWNFPTAVAKIPIMIRHAGASDLNGPRVSCWETALHAFSELRNMNGYVSIDYTPGQNHNFSFVRYMAIPFYEAVLAQRLPDMGSVTMKDMDAQKAWLGDTATHQVYKLSGYPGNKQAMSWLPDSVTADKWREYVTTGTIVDKTPPPPPYYAEIKNIDKATIDLSWKANADIESGIKYFNIYKNNQFVQRYPSGDFQSFDTNGDNCLPITPQSLTCRISGINRKSDTFAITTVNHFGLESSKYNVKKGKSSRIKLNKNNKHFRLRIAPV
jgi:pimeloyl-ACP methyl ester carboxylesterase